MKPEIKAVARRLKATKKLLVCTGAGVSKESGIPTFRGDDGLWRQYRAEELATPQAFARNPKLVWEWYRWRQDIIKKAKPNGAHHAIVQLEKLIPDFLLVTQNVDNLHFQAGSRKLIELHGNIFRAKCSRCDKKYSEPLAGELPECQCGDLIRPDVVWFGESLDVLDLDRAFGFAESCETVLVVGTSGIVQPAASIPYIAKENGAFVVEINPVATPITEIADLTIFEPSGEAMPVILARMSTEIDTELRGLR
jgi:NAD-dependent deacetylase